MTAASSPTPLQRCVAHVTRDYTGASRPDQRQIPLNKITPRGTLLGVRARGATPRELEALYRAGFERFVRVATAICRDSEGGRDAVQSAFVAALKNRRSFRGSGTLEAWVWQIVVNEARRNVDFFRARLSSRLRSGRLRRTATGAMIRTGCGAGSARCRHANARRCSSATSPTSTTGRSRACSTSNRGRSPRP